MRPRYVQAKSAFANASVFTTFHYALRAPNVTNPEDELVAAQSFRLSTTGTGQPPRESTKHDRFGDSYEPNGAEDNMVSRGLAAKKSNSNVESSASKNRNAACFETCSSEFSTDA